MKSKITICSMFVLLALFANTAIHAQDTFLSLLAGRDISGSGLGGNFCPAISLTHRNSTFSLGPNFQRRRMNFSGYQFNYRYVAARTPNEKFELYFTGNATYHFSAFMSRANVEIEQSCHKEQADLYPKMKLSVVEGYVGIGMKYDIIKQISVGSSVGIGMFNTLNADYDREMFREKSAPALMLRAILIYNLRK